MANNQPAKAAASKAEASKEDARSAIFAALRALLRIYQDDFVVNIL